MTVSDPMQFQGQSAHIPGSTGVARSPSEQAEYASTNVGTTERAVSVTAGSILALMGLARRDLAGLIVAGVGGGLIYRGASGSCPMYSALGIDTAHDQAEPQELQRHGTRVVESYIIDKSPQELYAFWRNFENLPSIMSHLESVKVLDDNRSHWVAKAPRIAGGSVEWDAEIVQDQPNSLIEWRSLPGAQVDNTGSIRFEPALGTRGTMVRVSLKYLPPAGQIGRWVAKLFGEAPEHQIHEDLRNFKRKMETGEIPTTSGQPAGSCTGLFDRHSK